MSKCQVHMVQNSASIWRICTASTRTAHAWLKNAGFTPLLANNGLVPKPVSARFYEKNLCTAFARVLVLVLHYRRELIVHIETVNRATLPIRRLCGYVPQCSSTLDSVIYCLAGAQVNCWHRLTRFTCLAQCETGFSLEYAPTSSSCSELTKYNVLQALFRRTIPENKYHGCICCSSGRTFCFYKLQHRSLITLILIKTSYIVNFTVILY